MSETAKMARPSPAIVVAVVALVAALAGTAIAGPSATTSISKKSVKKTAKKEAAKYFDANIGGASVASAASATNADSAANASQLGGQSPSAFRTGAASTTAGDATFPGTGGENVLTTTITLPSTKTVTAFATVRTTNDGGGTSSLECFSRIAGVGGISSTIDLDGDGDHDTLPVTQSRTLGAGTHTVLVRCVQDVTGPPDVEVTDRALSVVATG